MSLPLKFPPPQLCFFQMCFIMKGGDGRLGDPGRSFERGCTTSRTLTTGGSWFAKSLSRTCTGGGGVRCPCATDLSRNTDLKKIRRLFLLTGQDALLHHSVPRLSHPRQAPGTCRRNLISNTAAVSGPSARVETRKFPIPRAERVPGG